MATLNNNNNNTSVRFLERARCVIEADRILRELVYIVVRVNIVVAIVIVHSKDSFFVCVSSLKQLFFELNHIHRFVFVCVFFVILLWILNSQPYQILPEREIDL